jgi:hypothetical protein
MPEDIDPKQEETMVNLYWKKGKQTASVEEKPFKSETELEQFLFANQEILGGDITIVHRQIRTGSKQGIPDMLGVDQDSRICIIELKNEEADEGILPQALGYALWAETNPDSIKAIWLESKVRPDGVSIDFDNVDIRIVLIAPSFRPNLPRMAHKIGYAVDLLKIQRYAREDNEFMLVELLEETSVKTTTTKTLTAWTWDVYESEHGKDATTQFRKMVETVAAHVEKKGWNLPYNLNKYYTGFKMGNRVVFSISWGGTYAWHLKIKIPEKVAREFKGENWEFQRYDGSFNEAVFRPLKQEGTVINELLPLLETAYEDVLGKR